ncbi:Universal stress protein [gamma proteobacterium HdN1]|nr:Universal stress protein [gamma proteobacterium HdN1]
MKEIGKILAAVDLSESSIRAAKRAAMLALAHDAQLELLNVVESGLLEQLRVLLGSESSEQQLDVVDNTRLAVGALATDLHEQYGVFAAVRVVSGRVVRCLSDETDALGADLVVMGARGQNIAKDILFGSTAENMLQKNHTPALIVKHAPAQPYQRVLVPVDFSPASRAALDLARRMVPNAELIVMNAFIVPYEGQLRMASVADDTIEHYRDMALNESRYHLRQFLRAAGLGEDDCRSLAVNGDAWMAILEQQKKQQCDLVVMGKNGSGVIEDFLLGSVTKMVLRRASCDVMVAS